jgi:transcriptional regulator with PAS, ATPase and Fis domain
MTSEEIQKIKNKYDIIGNDPKLSRAIEVAMAVSPTDLSVLITGESGVGKDVIPRIIHDFSLRKTKKYIPINCGAIPEGTIESELFGHEKGAFTSASDSRRGYFEEADGGTIFLDEIAELPLQFLAKLLRVLQSGEFMRMGSSKVLKTDVRVIAATNVNIIDAIAKGKFRADLYYRLNTIPIIMPSLRERPEDINLLFRKFAVDFAEKYSFVKINLTPEASNLLKSYRWPGNIRQLKNVAETVSAIESGRQTSLSGRCEINAETLSKYIPRDEENLLPALTEKSSGTGFTSNEKSQIIGALYTLNQEVSLLKKEIAKLKGETPEPSAPISQPALPPAAESIWSSEETQQTWSRMPENKDIDDIDEQVQEERVFTAKDDDLSFKGNKEELVRKALTRHGGNRTLAAKDLEISERTLYRLLKKYGIN